MFHDWVLIFFISDWPKTELDNDVFTMFPKCFDQANYFLEPSAFQYSLEIQIFTMNYYSLGIDFCIAKSIVSELDNDVLIITLLNPPLFYLLNALTLTSSLEYLIGQGYTYIKQVAKHISYW